MSGSAGQPRVRARRMPLFVTCAPGLRRMLRRELAAIDGVEVTGTGFDGQCDVVFADADAAGRPAVLPARVADAVCAEIRRADRAARAGPEAVASMAWQPGGVERALSVWAQEVRPLAGTMTAGVTARVLGDSTFPQQRLRQVLADLVARDRPRWRHAAAPQLDIRICEWHDGQYAAGLRLADGSTGGSDAPGRLRSGPGVLPDSAAAAMVQLAGAPPGRGDRTLVDPCCGTGAVLAQALAAGWSAAGTDIDPAAVAAASARLPGADVQLGDARELLLADDSVAACASWLPAGGPPGGWEGWARLALAELSRVTRSGGPVVLLAPGLPRSAIPAALRLRRQVPLRLAGGAESIWAFRRA